MSIMEKPGSRLKQRPTTLDGGYGWVVVAASFIAHSLQYGVVWSVGVFYVLFMQNIDGEPGAMALLSSLNTATFYVTGPLAAMLTNKYGCRPVAMVGGFLGSLGLIMSVFATNIYYMYATFGILTGFGLGLSFIPAVSVVGFYFKEKRSLAIGIAVSGVGMGTFAFPPIIRLLVYSFGYRGALLLTGGICMNLVVCGALYKPVVTPISDSPCDSTLNVRSRKAKEALGDAPPKRKIFHFNIFQNTTYCLLALNNILVCFGMSIIYVHLSAYAASLGHSDDAGALLISVIGVSNFLGRLMYGALGMVPRVKPIYFYTLSFVVTGVGTVLCPLVSHYAALMAFAVLFGLTTAALGSLLPLLIVNSLTVDLLPSGYGYMLVFEAIGTLIGGPVAGALYQWSEYYALSLFLGGAAMMASGVVMIYPCIRPSGSQSFSKAEIEEEEVLSANLKESYEVATTA